MAAKAIETNATRMADPREFAGHGETLLLEHTGLVRCIAYHLFRRRHYVDVDVDDLIGAGMIGLLEAAARPPAHLREQPDPRRN
jgi:DNA-directed RNA polymerase specialized sigma subunit